MSAESGLSPTCPTCGDLCPPEATVCDCGERLYPTARVLRSVAPKCSCGGRGLCTVCVLAEYDGPTDDQIYNRPQYVPDGRSENDPSL